MTMIEFIKKKINKNKKTIFEMMFSIISQEDDKRMLSEQDKQETYEV